MKTNNILVFIKTILTYNLYYQKCWKMALIICTNPTKKTVKKRCKQ